MPTDAVNRIGDIAVDAIANRLAGLKAVQQCDLLGVGLQPVGEDQKRFLAIDGTHLGPHSALKCLAGRANGQIDILGSAGCHASDHLAVGRILRGKCAATSGRLEFAVDERLGAKTELCNGRGNRLTRKG